ncbi:hypothetical protein AZI86_05660 [Bdellovibrio bacteriovorus]|uniref:Uncharacterized protein n=1 Tax=Bdellovibrio bacteriovorus TaxID=959 RepID=A0A150WPV5_BDEBC|nr:hypothetical protein [Bdellovibrio bacteriovorus]KYG66531.1 hypothetical protein AZI86_05660 [Bdellovibrio bacteriovorus]
MDAKKDLQKAKAPEHSQDKKTSTSTGSSSSSVSSSAGTRSQPAKSVDESMKELAGMFFQIKRAESSGKALTPAQTERAKELVADLKAAEVRFYGIISKCWISGNDCHMLNESLEIMRHFRPNEEVPEGFQKARSLIPGLPSQVVALMVYSNQIQYLFLDGSTQVAESSNA